MYTVGINKENIILVGSSMGGFIANGIFAREMNVVGLANINGSGSFVLSEKVFRKLENRNGISLEDEKLLRTYDPIERKNCQAPILLIHGDADRTVPIDGQKDYYRYLLDIEDKKDIEFMIHKGIDHKFTLNMVKDLINWLNKITIK